MAIGYVISCWLLLQVADLAFDIIGTPDWAIRTIAAIMALGFPVVLLFSWAYELTPEGIKRESEVGPAESISHVTGRRLDISIAATLVLALGYFAWEPQLLPKSTETSTLETTASQSINGGGELKKRSIAILPFVSMSSDTEHEWFADGLTNDLLNSLARTTDLLVTARTSVFKYKGSSEDIPTIAKALGVENVLEGSVRRNGDRIRVTATLIKAEDGFHLWSQDYDRTVTDLIDLQEELATSIAHALETAVDPEALAAMMSVGTRSVEAYESYLRGLDLQYKTFASVDFDDANASLNAFERAIELDPKFSRAYMGIAESWAHERNASLTPSEQVAVKVTALDNAIKYEKDPVSRLYYQAQKSWQQLDLLTALHQNTQFLEARPNSQDGQHQRLNILLLLRRYDEAAEAVKVFYGRDGYDVRVTDVSLHILRESSDKKFAIEFSRMVMERFPDQPLLLGQSHRALLAAGDIETARGVQSKYKELRPHDSAELMTLRQLCTEGRNQDAIKFFDTLRANGMFDETSPVGQWYVYKLFSRDEEAARVLTDFDSSEDWRPHIHLIGVSHFDPRPYPSLMALLENKGIPPPKVSKLPYRCRYGADPQGKTGGAGENMSQ